jgi:hypothetical protein
MSARLALVRALVGAAAATLVLALAGCDPCFGVASCEWSSPRVVLNGQIVEATEGSGVDFVRIDVIRVGGAALEQDSASVETSNGGHWRIEIPARESGEALFDVRVHSEALSNPYTVRGVRAPTVSRKGDAMVLDRWVVNPYFALIGEMRFHGTDEPLSDTPIDFHRTAGPALAGPAVDGNVVHVGTDRFGRTDLFLYNAFATDTGEVVGDLVVRLPDPYGTTTISGVRLSPTYLYRATPRVGRYGVGPTLEYAAVIFDRATGKPAPNVVMNFRRISGIPLSSYTFTVTSGTDGRVAFRTRPLATGSVVADITLRHPRGNPETFRDTITTFDADGGRLAGIWTAGPYLPYFGVAYSFGQPVAGMAVRVRRTGGIDVTPADTVISSMPSGTVVLGPVPLAAGDVILELTFTPPAPYRAFMIRNLRLATIQQDVPQGRILWVWNLENGPSGPPGTEIVLLP